MPTPADYRLMTEATGQRIAAALEALSGTPAAAAAARQNLDVYSTSETDAAIAQSTAYHVGDTYNFASAQTPFRTLADRSAIYFCIHMPKAIGNDVTGFNVSFSGAGNTWFSNGSAGSIPTDATIGNKSISGSSVVRFTTTTSATPLANSGFGIAELYGTITFT